MKFTPPAALVWFRRDLRDFDHTALSHALAEFERVYCAFVFDTEILDALASRTDRRVEFIRDSLVELDEQLGKKGGGLIVRQGAARDVIPRLAHELGVAAVFCNRDYEPQAVARDATVGKALESQGVALRTFKDQVIFERREVLSGAGKPFSVYTPYRNAWMRQLTPRDLAPHPCDAHPRLAPPPESAAIPTLAQIGFEPTNLHALKLPCGMTGARSLFADFLARIDAYHERRDYPAIKGPSYLSTHLRFGTISIRELAREAHVRMLHGSKGAEIWLNELVWRDFYHMILALNPHVVGASFRPEYDAVQFDQRPDWYAAWCEGRTGYPLVDAAMRQLDATGYMHNRLRMVAASFLVKDLGIDWRQGEAWFARQLNDFDLASNNGGWQWAASTGCDAQPYFRIFNPVTQSERFDATGAFIRRYVPELVHVPDKRIHAPWLMSEAEQQVAGCRIGTDYPAPLVEHAVARARTLVRYKVVKAAGGE
ncbi:MAG TPA: deoxyribodipyrimidine photo-lyase [Rhodocyclaceae bacterium]|nr:deoxyribodipyrimidine photo-lyase [Rhodocyclaceae bacterium]HMV53404.1 deoxyribodipyrimidine photo-lyase [Rhodocyclaceae bacterium]HMZ83105.1 deoxyribodipyrimidine photo-lyase [Rhodocyclaceae bacterium]HNA02662.1 deoxyribodipyrimidine photo-lyase [Rhodocyclaceae bacterium]HNB77747.1 deoxyribodipyrimidine photo-lyase [Rhodocyclaceae bacterium]